MEFAKHIDSAELNDLPLRAFEGTVHLISTFEEYQNILPELRRVSLFGFDTETRPSFKKGVSHPVSLLQLSTDDTAYLFRLNKIGLPAGIVSIFSNPNIIKVGAAIHDDLKSLKNLHKFKPAGFIDLQDEVRKLAFESFSLKKMAGIVLGFRISKSQQLSNWDAESLTEPQLVYAATDAWVSLQVFKRIRGHHQ